jgi:regulator of sigma E protease
MSFLITIISFFIVLAVLVVAHELGHFLTAKWRGVRVHEFGIGFPPRIWGIKRGETVYTINAVPLGGFVKMAGEEDPNIERSLASKGYGSRLLVLSAGPIMNLLLPVILFSAAFMIPHDNVIYPVKVDLVAENSPAETAGFQIGDTILTVHGRELNNSVDLQRYVQIYLGHEIDVTVERTDGSIETLQVEPRWTPPEGEGAMGIRLEAPGENYQIATASEPFFSAVGLGVRECWETLALFKNEIISWFIGTSSPQLSGPVGIAELTGEVVKSGFSNVIEFAAFLSINLGIINLLPLPALDGGRIVFVLLEMVRKGRKVSTRTEGLIHTAGFLLLIGLMIAITFNDVVNIITTGSALPF